MNILARTLKGFRDFLPEKQIPREQLIDKIKKTYQTFGFSPLETPVLEYADVLTGKYGDEGDKLMYKFRDNGDREVAMRYDLTIPLARVVAEYPELKKPFKRYQISPVWRAENTQKGRFREFYQCDADIIGSDSPLADAEILALSAQTMYDLGVRNFVVRVNSREIISAFYGGRLKLTLEKQLPIIRIVDKIDKIGADGIKKELITLGLKDSDADAVIVFSKTVIDSVDDLSKITELFPETKESLNKLYYIIAKAQELVPDANFKVDFSIARGLDYYTGMIFETNLNDLALFGSVLSGGRYDKLVGMFGKNDVSAVGASVGLDRLFSALEELKLVDTNKQTVAEVFVLNLGEELLPEYNLILRELRMAHIKTVFYFSSIDMKKQLAYASTLKIPFAVIFGENEKKEGIILVKDLNVETNSKTILDTKHLGKQEKIKMGELTSYILKMLDR